MAQCIAMKASIRSRSAKMLCVKYGTRSMPSPAASWSSAACVRYIERYCQRSLQPIQPACGSAGLKTNSVEGVASSTWPRLLTTEPPFSVTATTRASWMCGGYSWVVKSARIRLRPVRCRSHQYSVEFLGSLRATPENTRPGQF